MKTEIDRVIENYKSRYLNIFKNYYPAHDGTGFTERNLSVNFASAFESIHSNSFTWYEVPVGESKKEHIDAIIFNIESKRFANPRQAVNSINNDISKMTDKANKILITKELANHEEYKYFGVVLADVWTENDFKKKIYNNWSENFFNEFLLESENCSKLVNRKWEKRDFKNDEVKYKSIKDKYNLLMLIGEIS